MRAEILLFGASMLALLNLPFVISGLGVGLIVGLTGVGGGALMTPLLVLVFGIHPAAAVGTDLLYAAATKGVGTLVHGISRSIEWRIVGLLGAGSVPATLLTSYALHHSDMMDPGMTHLLTRILTCALVVTALSLLFRGKIQRLVLQSHFSMGAEQRQGITVIFGVILGVLVTLTSIGAGSIGVSVLLILYPSLPVSRIVGTDIAHAVPLTLVAGLGHLGLGTVDTALLASLLCGSIPGVIIGSLMGPRLPEVGLRLALASVLLAVSVMLFLK